MKKQMLMVGMLLSVTGLTANSQQVRVSENHGMVRVLPTEYTGSDFGGAVPTENNSGVATPTKNNHRGKGLVHNPNYYKQIATEKKMYNEKMHNEKKHISQKLKKTFPGLNKDDLAMFTEEVLNNLEINNSTLIKQFFKSTEGQKLHRIFPDLTKIQVVKLVGQMKPAKMKRKKHNTVTHPAHNRMDKDDYAQINHEEK